MQNSTIEFRDGDELIILNLSESTCTIGAVGHRSLSVGGTLTRSGVQLLRESFPGQSVITLIKRNTPADQWDAISALLSTDAIARISPSDGHDPDAILRGGKAAI